MKKKTGLIIAGSLLFGGLMFYLLRRRGYTFVDTGVWCDNEDCSNIDDVTAEQYVEYCETQLGYNRGLNSGGTARIPDNAGDPGIIQQIQETNTNKVPRVTQACTIGGTGRNANYVGGWANILLDGPYAKDFEAGEEVYIEQDEESQVFPEYNGDHKIIGTKGDYVVTIDVERQGSSMPVGGKIYRKSILSDLMSGF